MEKHEIICPNCGKAFTVDEASFANIVKQVRDQEFSRDLEERIHSLERNHKSELELANEKAERALQERMADKEKELAEAKAQVESLKARMKAEADALKMQMKAEADALKMQMKAEAESAATREKALREGQETAVNLATERAKNEVQKEIQTRDAEISELKLQVEHKRTEQQQIKEGYELRLKDREDEIERLKEMKMKLSTKGVGESLEQYCSDEFNKARAMAFPNAYFEKDNEVSGTGSKGDFIFRDLKDGVESVSIMFEMKNENETTKTKHKNEDFFAELDKDRKEKGCEYAVLVSMLEAESELYNQGIVDVSYRYPKMYVVRPQFFIPMITLLRNAAEKSLEVKRDLALAREQNIDVTNFENDLETWKAGWMVNMKNAGKKHVEAIEQINKAIKDLEKTRDALMLSDKHLAVAEGKMEGLTVKKLTAKNPTMKEKFRAAGAEV